MTKKSKSLNKSVENVQIDDSKEKNEENVALFEPSDSFIMNNDILDQIEHDSLGVLHTIPTTWMKGMNVK